MRIRDVLRSKGTDVVTVEPDRTVLAAVRILSEHRIGALVVLRGDVVEGIISERDVLNLVAAEPGALERTEVRDIMTPDPVVGAADDELGHVMDVMTENRVRHLPVVRDGRLEGLISIGDVVNALRRSVERENRHLKDYIHGAAG